MSRTIYAVLIGINDYPIRPLGGCINDVLAVYSFFSKLPASDFDFKPLLLLAPRGGDDKIAMQNAGFEFDKTIKPTRTQIIEAFKHFNQAQADKQDVCLLYYSGHGSYQEAPDELRFDKDLPQVETIVCLDEAPNTMAEIIDKELSYLIYKTTKGKTSTEGHKNLHFLSIMDCCYSGDNTRSVVSNQKRYTPTGKITSIKNYLDFDKATDFYQLSADGKTLKTANAPHQALAATQDNELANERTIDGIRRGVFTYFLLKTLRNNAIFNTYQEIMSRIRIDLEQLFGDQNPTISKYQQKTDIESQTLFLGVGIKPSAFKYPVFYKEIEQKWFIKAGAIDGILPTTEQTGVTLVKLLESNLLLKVTNVLPTESELLLAPSVMEQQKAIFFYDDKPRTTLMAEFVKMATSKIKVFINETLDESVKNNLATKSFIDLVEDKVEAQFIVEKRDENYLTMPIDKKTPLFRRTSNLSELAVNLNKVGKWYSLMQLNNTPSVLNTDDVSITVEIIEGKNIEERNLQNNDLKAIRLLKNPTEIAVQYQGNEMNFIQPAIRVHIRSEKKDCYIGALYLTSLYGSECLLPAINTQAGGNGLWLKKKYDEGPISETIVLAFDKTYHKWGVSEIQDYLKVFVSNRPFNLDKHEQTELQLDDFNLGKAVGKAESYASFQDWYCITIPVRINWAIDTKELTTAAPLLIGGAELTAPNNFSATVRAKSVSEIRHILKRDEQNQQSLNKEVLQAFAHPQMLSNIFGTTTELFSKTLNNVPSDGQLSVLELTNVKTDALSAQNPLKFKPNEGLEDDETMVAFSYDPEQGLFIPVGVSDENGVVNIEKLPPQYEGSLFASPDDVKRGLWKSIGLMFVRIVTEPFVELELNTLAMSKVSEGTYELTPFEPIEKKNKPLADASKNIVLLIHGIIGDTEGQVRAFQNDVDLRKNFNIALSFDYENLRKPIEETAENLKEQLSEAGLFDKPSQRLTIVAHSMGGLVSRHFIEKLGGDKVVKKLIQLGSPNGGSELSEFRKHLGDFIMLGLNQVPSVKPYMKVIRFLAKHAGNTVFVTLNQMDPKHEFISDLKSTLVAPVPYHIIAGSTLQEVNELGKDKLAYKALNYLVFGTKPEDENDMAVKKSSMSSLPNFQSSQLTKVACNHINYFDNEKSMAILKNLL
jgi:pimeloyl-ACP methyl ester carboxylesterase